MFRQSLRIVPKQNLWNITSSFSSEPVIPKLIKNLKDIRSCNNAQKLCGVLFSANIAVYEPKFAALSSWDSYEKNLDVFVSQLRDILQEDKPEYVLVDMISKKLFADDSSKRSELMDLLVNVDSHDSQEYLEQLISGFEYLMNTCDKDSHYSSHREKYPYSGIDLLQFLLRKSAVKQADDILNIIYDIGRKHQIFTKDEEKEVGALMTEAIIPISKCVIHSRQRPVKLESSLLRKRSSLQFLKDFYAKFPSKNGALLENFYGDDIDKCIMILDRLIIDWCGVASNRIANSLDGRKRFVSDLKEKDQSETHLANNLDGSENVDTDLEENDPSEMPESHTWWPLCSSFLVDMKKYAT